MRFFSKIGITLVGIQTLLVALVPLFAKLFPTGCNIICIFSEQQGYFILFNVPGMFLLGLPFMYQLIMSLETPQQRLSGQLTPAFYIVVFLLSALVYYFIGFGIEKLFHKQLKKVKRKTWKVIFIAVMFTFALIAFIAIAQSIVSIVSNLGQVLK